jgi:GntR family transcriptional regulator/MocR family aminotransferase
VTTSRTKGIKTSSSPLVSAHLPLRRHSGVPLYRQIYDGFRQAILGGLLRAGQRIPSTRALAAELEVSRFPVLAAYEQLLHEGYLAGRIGAGTFVSATLPDDALRPVPAARGSGRSVKPAHTARPGRREPERERPQSDGGLRPFRMSLPGLDQFPLAIWARLVARHARGLTPPLMAYGDPAGLETLRGAVAEYLRTARAVRCEADQVIILSGSQAALRIAATVLLARGDVVAVEEPGYPGAREALRASGAELAPIPVDEQGLSVAALGRLGTRVRAAYVTPSHQYPLGVSMTATRRLELLEWAERHGTWLLEDDYDSEYRYVSRPLGSLQGMDEHARVIYIGSFSKVLFPSLRVGYLIVPRALRRGFLEAREALDIFSPALSQLALADFLGEGHFARHLRRMRAVYLNRRAALLDGLERHCAGRLTLLNADGGLHAATVLPAGSDDVAVVERMDRHGLTATALSTCYTGPARRNGLLLGFGGFGERRLVEATRALGAVLRHAVG